jgi:hypothetical protein
MSWFFNKGANDAATNKGPANTHGLPWQSANQYNAGYNSKK